MPDEAFQTGDRIITPGGFKAVVTGVRWSTVNVKFTDDRVPFTKVAVFHSSALRKEK